MSSPKPRRTTTVYEDDDGNTWEEQEDEDVTDKPRFELNLIDDKMVRPPGTSRCCPFAGGC